MKDVCLVAAYTPDQEREDMLRNLTRFLKGKKDVVLISHSITPKDILDDVSYYFYDEQNELISSEKAPSFWWFQDIGNAVIWSNDVWYKTAHQESRAVGFQMLPCTRNFFFGLAICKFLQYDYAHYIEYDSKIDSVDFINEHNKLLADYDGICYWTENNHPHGAFLSYNLNSYSFADLHWDRDIFLSEFLDILKDPKEGSVENFVLDKMTKGGKNILKKDLSELDLVLTSCSPELKGKYDYIPCIFVIKDDGVITFFSKNIILDKIKVTIVINTFTNYDFDLEPGFWILYDVGNISDIKKVYVYLNDEKIKEYNFNTQEEIDKHRENNKITYK